VTPIDAEGPWAVSPEVLAALEAHARAERPRECCGVLIGVRGRLLEARPAANLSDDPNRYELDPRTHVRAMRDTRGTGREVVGFYHSHPHSAAVPSATDLAGCTYPELLHIIVGLWGERADVRAWRLGAIAATEVALQIGG
jgi:proteasome lid subunit RPN8/RPN11